jgi:hypothetical protein
LDRHTKMFSDLLTGLLLHFEVRYDLRCR